MITIIIIHKIIHYHYLPSLNLKISPKTPRAVTAAPAPAPIITIGFSP